MPPYRWADKARFHPFTVFVHQKKTIHELWGSNCWCEILRFFFVTASKKLTITSTLCSLCNKWVHHTLTIHEQITRISCTVVLHFKSQATQAVCRYACCITSARHTSDGIRRPSPGAKDARAAPSSTDAFQTPGGATWAGISSSLESTAAESAQLARLWFWGRGRATTAKIRMRIEKRSSSRIRIGRKTRQICNRTLCEYGSVFSTVHCTRLTFIWLWTMDKKMWHFFSELFFSYCLWIDIDYPLN
jgi:hypothetical protein